MAIMRQMTIEERTQGTVNQQVEYHCDYKVLDLDDDSNNKQAAFLLGAVISASSVAQATWDAVIAAIQTYGDAACGGWQSGMARFLRVDARDAWLGCVYRLVPPQGSPIIREFEIADVQAANPSITAQQWTDVIGALQVYGDAAAGYVP